MTHDGAPSTPPAHAISPSDLEREATLRVPECDLARRRRFLKLVAGGVGALAVGSGRLGSALKADEPVPVPGCTTTTTYTSASSSATTCPSGRSYSFSGTEPGLCTGTLTWSDSMTSANSYIQVGPYGGYDGTSTFHGSSTTQDGQAGTNTTSYSCANGTRSFTYSYPSFPSYTVTGSWTESGTRTVTCEGHMASPPMEMPLGASAALPATLESENDVLHFQTRLRVSRERRLRFLDDSARG